MAGKEKLIKEGKHKKENPLSPITDLEKPFDNTDSWQWTYIGEILQHNTGKAFKANRYKSYKAFLYYNFKLILG